MTLTLLLDLDDTLLGTNLDSFIKPYLERLSARLAPYVNPVLAARQLLYATSMMVCNQLPDRTLEQVFDDHFFPPLGITRAEVQQAIDDFYAQDFPGLRVMTTTFPEARGLIDQAAKRGMRIGIATAPLFPMIAIKQRLEWAGFPQGDHPFELVSSYDSFHFTKPHPDYFAEFLGRMGWPEGPVVMVGNDFSDDILGARKLGLSVFWIDHGNSLPAEHNGSIPHGSLQDFFDWLDLVPEASLMPVLDQPDGMRAILRATPAALAGLVAQAPPDALRHRPANGEWAPSEVLCHLRDVDAEVNLPRFELIQRQPNPFIAGRNTDAWTESRNYLAQDGLQALVDFTNHRKQLMTIIDALSPADWELPVRHAIFGPTHLRELVRIITEHDRLHIRQVFETLALPNQA